MHRAAPAILLAIQTLLPAQDPMSGRGSIRIGKEGFVVQPGEIELRELIDKSALFLKRNILYRSNELAQAGEPLVFQNELAVDAPGCEDLLAQLLYQRGFALATIDAGKGLYEAVLLSGPRGREVFAMAVRRSPEEVLRRPTLKVYVVTEVALQHLNAQIATNALRPFFSQFGSGQPMPTVMFGTAGSERSLLVSGFQDQVAQVLRMLQTCDVAPVPAVPDAASRIEQLEVRVRDLASQLQAIRTVFGGK